MQERARAGSTREFRRSVHGPAQGQGNPSDITPQGQTSTSTSSSNTYDAGQYAASTPQTISTSSASHTPVGSIPASDYFPAPLQAIQSHRQMSVDNPQPPNPPSLDYGAYNYAPGGALVWEFDNGNSLEVPDFARFYEPQGELVQELQDQQQTAGDFALPEPVSRRESGTTLQTAQLAASQQPLGGVTQSPVQMPVVLGGTATHQQQPPGPPPPPPRQMSTQSGQSQTSLKRKSETDTSALPPAGDDTTPSSKRPARARTGSTATAPSNTGDRKPMATRSQSAINAAQPVLTIQTSDDNNNADNTSSAPGSARPAANEAGNISPTTERPSGRDKSRKVVESPSKFSNILPAGKVFPIQIGSELFRLSGASISSDGEYNFLHLGLTEMEGDAHKLAAPSYFSHFFSEQLLSNTGKSGTIRTLYIDRDPQTFKDISLHLQGMYL